MDRLGDDARHFWLPFTENRAFRRSPRLLARAEGLYFYDPSGARLIDACSGLFCSPLGHGRREIGDAVAAQHARLDFAPPFRYAHVGAFELAARVAEWLPGDLEHLFFCNSGSEAVDTAIKLAFAYQRARGEPRSGLVSRERAYHGVNLGGTALSGLVRNREGFGPALPGVVHLRHTWLAENRFVAGQGERGADLADDLERLVRLHGERAFAACFVEPIAGSTGVLVPPRGYLERLRRLCDRYGILLVFDEVITGFGRTGKAFAAQTFGVQPDMVTMAKALTNGTVPMGAVAVRREIHDRILEAQADPEQIELFHGYTYSAHPLACAAGIATQRIYRDEEVFERGEKLAPYFLERVFALRRHALVQDIRGFGLLAGVDLAPGDRFGARGTALLARLFESGVVVRITGDTLILAPALVASEAQVDEMLEKVERGLGAL
jgi:beta-alanine--pyruvate transaminase